METYRRVFGSEDGQVVLKHLCSVAYVTRPLFAPSQPDLMAFREGQRHLMLSILNFIDSEDITEIINQLKQV